VAQMLLEHGADMNHQSTKGCTALLLASNNGFFDLAELLLDHGADIEKQLVVGDLNGQSEHPAHNNNVVDVGSLCFVC
jgi:ankyrin repeat protein